MSRNVASKSIIEISGIYFDQSLTRILTIGTNIFLNGNTRHFDSVLSPRSTSYGHVNKISITKRALQNGHNNFFKNVLYLYILCIAKIYLEGD